MGIETIKTLEYLLKKLKNAKRDLEKQLELNYLDVETEIDTTNELNLINSEIARVEEIIKEYYASDYNELLEGFEWCRKGRYTVDIELGCYELADGEEPKEGFFEKKYLVKDESGAEVEKRFAVKSGKNILEQNTWTTRPEKPFIITGQVKERWTVKPTDLSSYEVEPSKIGIEPVKVSTKDPKDQPFLVAYHVPVGTKVEVYSKWAFKKDGTLDRSQILIANSEDSEVDHLDGDYIVAKHIDGLPEYMELPEEVRNTQETAEIYSPRVINGSVMAKTYDHDFTKIAIKRKHSKTLILGN